MSEQQYSDKPLAYLDQNILDLFTEPQCLLKKDSELFNFLKNEVQAVYSPTTLEEIYRSVINGKSSVYGLAFLDVLKELNAHFITLITENGEVSNTIFRSWEEPLIHFNQFVENNYLNKFVHPLRNNLFAIFGGIKDFNKLENEQIDNLNNLLIFLESSLKFLESCEDKDEYILSEIEKYKVEIPKLRMQQKEYESFVQLSVQHLEDANKEQAAHKKFRDSLKVDLNHLRKIEFPNVLVQIWKMLQQNNAELVNFELDDFFQLKKGFNSESEFYIFQKVNQIYTMLNLIGYHQDEGIHKKEKRFIASFSDMSHASYACFCEYLFTRDKNFSIKVRVAYEYLNVATHVVNIEVNSTP